MLICYKIKKFIQRILNLADNKWTYRDNQVLILKIEYTNLIFYKLRHNFKYQLPFISSLFYF